MPSVFNLKDLPRNETLLEQAKRYPHVDPSGFLTCLQLLQTAREVTGAFDAFLSSRGISQGRFTVLMLLNREPAKPSSPAELADHSGVTRATMTGLLEGLERDELISRRDDPSDGRRSFISLTQRGRDFLDTLVPAYFERLAALMSHLTDEQRNRLRDLLVHVHEGLVHVRH